MAEFLTDICTRFDNLLYGALLPPILVAAGVYFSFKTGFFQLRALPRALYTVCGGNSEKTKNGVSPFAAVCTALSATVGTGNIIGVAGAIAAGGPGTVFWIWVSALIGMIVKFFEVVLALLYRERVAGEWRGGQMYAVRGGLPRRFAPLGIWYALAGTAAAFCGGNLVQTGTITAAVQAVLPQSDSPLKTLLCGLSVGIITAALAGFALLGGAKRIGKFAAALVPFMALLYFVLTGGIIFINRARLPRVAADIFRGAFCPAAATGGAVANGFLVLKNGVARGLFSNEAGLGTSAMAHAGAETNNPVRQGLYGIFEVFADTGIICTLTAFAVLTGCPTISYGTAGENLPFLCFHVAYGAAAQMLLGGILCFFAFTSVLGWGLYGLRCVGFLFGKGAERPFLCCFCAVCIPAALSAPDAAWLSAEICNGLMTLPNIAAVVLLSARVTECLADGGRMCYNADSKNKKGSRMQWKKELNRCGRHCSPVRRR